VTPTLDQIVGWGFALGAGAAIAVLAFVLICEMCGISWRTDDDSPKRGDPK